MVDVILFSITVYLAVAYIFSKIILTNEMGGGGTININRKIF